MKNTINVENTKDANDYYSLIKHKGNENQGNTNPKLSILKRQKI